MRTTSFLCLVAPLAAACSTTTNTSDPAPVEAEAPAAVAPLTPVPARAVPQTREQILSANDSVGTLAALLGYEPAEFLTMDWPCSVTLNSGARADVTYDASGMPTLITADYMISDTITSGKFMYEYDDAGLIVHEHGCLDAVESGCDADDYASRTTRDAKGRVEATRSFFMRDGGLEGDGGLASTVTYTHGDDPLVIMLEETSGLGGKGDPWKEIMLPSVSKTTITYREGWEHVASIADPDGLSYTSSFDDAGNRTGATTFSTSEQTGEPLVVIEELFTFDAMGRVIVRNTKSFTEETGELESDYTFTYTYDDARPMRVVEVTRGDIVLTPDYACHDVK